MNNKFTLKSDNIKQFINILQLLSEPCSEVIIHDNIIRQGSDSKTLIFDIDLTDVVKYNDNIQQVNTVLLNLKNEVKLLELFIGEEDVQFQMKDKYMNISTSEFKYKYFSPDKNETDIKFIEKLPFNLNEEEKLVEFTISQNNVDRINKICDYLKTNNVILKFYDNYFNISIESNTRDADINLDNIQENNLFEWEDSYVKNKSLHFDNFPFKIAFDSSMKIELYAKIIKGKKSVNRNVILKFSYPSKFSNFVVYSISTFVQRSVKNMNERQIL